MNTIINNPLKVFHLLSNPGIGGIEGMLFNLIPKVDPNKCDMSIINMRKESKAYSLWDKNGVTYFKLGTPSRIALDGILALTKFLQKEKVDILEIYGIRANFIGRIAAKISGVPVVITGVLSTDDWRKWYHVWLDRLTSPLVSAWIPNSRACMESLIKREKFSPDKFRVIYDGIDVNEWKKNDKNCSRKRIRDEFGFRSDNILFATVGNLRHAKGYPYLIEAIPEIVRANSNVRFIFVGKGPMKDQLNEKCNLLGVSKYIRFTGYREDIKDIYEASDVALLPSLHEGLPICLIEAMSMELPVIATRVSGIPELIEEGETGTLIPSMDIAAIAEAVIKMADNSEKRIRMGRSGRLRVIEKFSIERMISHLLEFYRQLYEEVKGK